MGITTLEAPIGIPPNPHRLQTIVPLIDRSNDHPSIVEHVSSTIAVQSMQLGVPKEPQSPVIEKASEQNVEQLGQSEQVLEALPDILAVPVQAPNVAALRSTVPDIEELKSIVRHRSQFVGAVPLGV